MLVALCEEWMLWTKVSISGRGTTRCGRYSRFRHFVVQLKEKDMASAYASRSGKYLRAPHPNPSICS